MATPRNFAFALALVAFAAAGAWMLASPPPVEAACTSALVYGDTMECSLGVVGEEDAFTFSATSGDEVFVRMARPSGSVDPDIEIRRPDDTVPAGCSGGATYLASIDVTCSIDTTGTWSIVAADAAADDTGDYGLHLQRMDSPTGATAVSYGSTTGGSVVAGELDAFTFSGTSGDEIVVRMGTSAGADPDPQFWVITPAGATKCSASSSFSGIAQTICTLDATGTWTVLAGDKNGGAGGAFELHVQDLLSPVGATASSYGSTHAGTLTSAELDAFTFTGTSGDEIMVRMATSSGSGQPDPQFYIVSPSGGFKCTAGGTFTSVTKTCTLDATGTWSLLAGDQGAGTAGGYEIHLQRLDAPVGATASSYGSTHAGTLTSAEVDAYTFSGTSGDVIVARLANATTGTNPDPEVYIVSPTGVVTCSGVTTSYVRNQTCTLDATGTWTVLAADYNGSTAGAYELHLQRLDSPSGATATSYGSTHSGILSSGELEAYTFSGAVGDLVLVQGGNSSVTVNPDLHYYVVSPTGVITCDGYSTGPVLSDTCTLDASGTWLLLMGDTNGGTAGDYGVHLQRLNGPVGAQTTAYGQSLTSSISATSEVDAYVFRGKSGQQVKLDMTKNSGEFSPQVQLYRPDGSYLCGQGAVSAATVTCDLDVTGWWTITGSNIGFVQHAGTGNYTLDLTLTGEYAPPPFDPEHPTSDEEYPADLASGGLAHQSTDVAIPGRGVNLAFSRFYHAGSSYDGSIGLGWTHSYEMYVTDSTEYVQVFSTLR